MATDLFGVPGRIRTAGLSLRRRTLYPAELRRLFSSEKDFTKKLGDCQRKVKLFIKTAMSTCAGTAVAVF